MRSPFGMAASEQMFNAGSDNSRADFLAKYPGPDADKAIGDMKDYNPFASAMQDSNIGPSALGSLALNAAKEHPFKTAGLVGLGAGNIGGLMDNNKFGGQLSGLALGGLGSYLMGASPYTAAIMTMGGGELGALFDKLRAKKEQEQTQPYYGGR